MVWLPTPGAAIVSVARAWPLLAAKATGGSGVPSMVNVTIPPATPPPAVVTMAVKVTGRPSVAGFGVASSCVDVA